MGDIPSSSPLQWFSYGFRLSLYARIPVYVRVYVLRKVMGAAHYGFLRVSRRDILCSPLLIDASEFHSFRCELLPILLRNGSVLFVPSPHLWSGPM